VIITVFTSERDVAASLARHIAAALRVNPGLVLGLPTGRTPVLLYRELAALHARGEADFSQVTTFNLDEFLRLPAHHPGSYRTFMEHHLFSRINISPSRIHMLDGMAANPEGECHRYEAAIVAAGGIDLQILGIGTNGHIGFNEPAAELQAHTHRAALRPETRRSNAMLFGGDVEQVPAEALSMGMATILHARSIILLATGHSKAACVERMIHGPLTTRLPASFLQVHRDVQVMLDEAAAARLHLAAGARVDVVD
jgi:glucosamine-6-phosphate deaminase